MIDDEDLAARWAIRLDGAPLDDAEQQALDAWLTGNERNRGALLRAEAALAYLDRGRALAEPDVEDVEEDRRAVLGRRAVLIGGTASGLAAMAGVAFLALRAAPVEIGTAIGELRRVPLPDGSVASVNTDSKVLVAMARRHRDIRLERGEAWFQVMHDKSRPFVVAAGGVRVQAVGTAFSVRLREGGADVLVTEGVVETWVVGREAERMRIAAGSRSFVAETAPTSEVVSASADIDRALAWRSGELALNGESLDYAAAELNRYNLRKLIIDDPALGREPLVGYFRTDQPENFGRAAAGMVGAKVAIEGEAIHLHR